MKIIKKENAKQLFLSAETRIVLPECAYTSYIAEQLEKLLARARGEGTPCRAITMALGIPAAIRSLFADGAEGVQTLTLEEEEDYVENIDGPVAKPVKLGTNIACRTPSDREILEASYSTIAIPDEVGYLFEHVYENPYPEKKIASVSYLPLPDKAQIKVEYIFPEL